MRVDVRQPVGPGAAKAFDTVGLRQNFLVETLFALDEIRLTYTHLDRLIVGGAAPAAEPLTLEPVKETALYLEMIRRPG